jgi:hypothetical protein
LGPALAVVLLLTGIGTTAAAGASNPGDLLYPVKRADESVQLFVSPASARAEVYSGLARQRLDEMSVVLRRGALDSVTLDGLGDDLSVQTAQALAAVDQAPANRQADILNKLVQMTDEQQTVLATAKQKAPAAAQAGLDRAIQASSAGHARALARLEDMPGHQKPTSSPTPSATVSVTPTATATATPTATGSVTATGTFDGTHVPPGQTRVPPGQTKVPPGQTKIPPGLTQRPDQTNPPAGQTRVPPGQTKDPPGQGDNSNNDSNAGEHGDPR